MRKTTGSFLERCRVKSGPLGSNASLGFNGAFFVPYVRNPSIVFKAIVSNGEAWDHVSVSLPTRCPTWEELCWIKDIFWEEDEAVIQIHPPKASYVNNVRYCLHLFRPQDQPIPLPPDWLVGDKSLGTIG